MTTILGHHIHGAGDNTVILIHEWLGNHENWQDMRHYLPLDGMRWVVVDLRGYGWSKNIEGVYSLEEAASDIATLAQHLGAKRMHLAGHSMGGLVAQAVAAKHPGRVKSLGLICSVPASGFPADAPTKEHMQSLLVNPVRLGQAIRDRTGHRLGEGWVMRKAHLARRAGLKSAMSAYLSMFTESDITAGVTGLDLPVRLIAGAYDLPFYRLPSLRPLFEAWYPRLETVEILEAGHYPMLETPARLAALLEDWVRRHS
ncbi:MAG: alpha/beta hydrolase [Alphaproteobacteria bacterium]|nr:alpha/beta hydrolase [Alphaproteobacteria bacterium]